MATPPTNLKRTLTSSLVKNSITPCRRVGLGRPSSGSVTKMVHVRTLSTPVHHESPHVKIQSSAAGAPPPHNSQLKLPLRSNNEQNKELSRVRRCLAQNPTASQIQKVKRTYNESEIENCITTDEVLDSHSVEKLKNSRLKEIKPHLTLQSSSEKCREACDNVVSDGHKTWSSKNFVDLHEIEENHPITEYIIAQLASSLLEKNKKLKQIKVQKSYAKKHNLEELRGLTAKWRTAGQEALRHCVMVARQAGYTVTLLQLMTRHGFPLDLMEYNAEDDEFE